MFPSRMFTGSFFPRRYFPALGGVVAPVVQWIDALLTRTGVVRYALGRLRKTTGGTLTVTRPAGTIRKV